jgi:hypothetical protein
VKTTGKANREQKKKKYNYDFWKKQILPLIIPWSIGKSVSPLSLFSPPLLSSLLLSSPSFPLSL